MIQFKNGHFQDGKQPITLEDSMRLAATLAGIHDFDFESIIEEPFGNLDDWSNDAAGTFEISSSRFSITGAGDDRYYRAWHDTEVSPSFVASFDAVYGHGQILLLGNDSGKCFSAWWTGDDAGFSLVHAGGEWDNLIQYPIGIAAPARVQLVVKYSLDTNDAVRWLHASLFADGSCVVGLTLEVSSSAYDWIGTRLGFSAIRDEQSIVDNLVVSAFSRVVDWTTVDIGDNPASGMSRAVGTTRMARAARHDGTMHVWRPGNRDQDWLIPDSRPTKMAYRHEKTEVVTHVRTRGVLYQTDVFDDSEGRSHGHKFTMTDDPNLFTIAETRDEALKVLHNETEKQVTAQLEMPPNFALEAHDRVKYDGQDWRIMGIQRGVVVSGNAVVPKSTLNLQRYIEQ
jgi:hypothetical protein